MTKHFIYERLGERHLGLIGKPGQLGFTDMLIFKKERPKAIVKD